MITQREGDLIINTVKCVVNEILNTYDITIQPDINFPEEYAVNKIKETFISLRKN